MGNPVLKRQCEMTMEDSLSGQGYGHLQELLIFIFKLKIYQTEGACAPVFIKGLLTPFLYGTWPEPGTGSSFGACDSVLWWGCWVTTAKLSSQFLSNRQYQDWASRITDRKGLPPWGLAACLAVSSLLFKCRTAQGQCFPWRLRIHPLHGLFWPYL